jgi:hypothetical protein
MSFTTTTTTREAVPSLAQRTVTSQLSNLPLLLEQLRTMEPSLAPSNTGFQIPASPSSFPIPEEESIQVHQQELDNVTNYIVQLESTLDLNNEYILSAIQNRDIYDIRVEIQQIDNSIEELRDRIAELYVSLSTSNDPTLLEGLHDLTIRARTVEDALIRQLCNYRRAESDLFYLQLIQ